MNVKQAKETDMVAYLSKLGYEPAYKLGNNQWYHSPLRNEKTPSFSVNFKTNEWYDWGEGKGGNIIDFGIAFHNCSVAGFLAKLDEPSIANIAKHKAVKNTLAKDDDGSQIKILRVHALTSLPLLHYLEKRRIPKAIADEYCSEVDYQLNNKNYYAIGFPNNAGGYELRNEYIKAASSPKAVTFVDCDANENAVFEGFFNFLSYKTMLDKQPEPPRNYLILNSTSFFERSLPFMQLYDRNFLFLDHDKTGNKFTEMALQVDKKKFIDERKLYEKYSDLNDWLMHIGRPEKHRLTIKH